MEHLQLHEEKDWGVGGGARKLNIIEEVQDRYIKEIKIIEVAAVSVQDTPAPPFQVIPDAQVMWGYLSYSGAVGQSGSSCQSSIGWSSDKVGRAASEISLSPESMSSGAEGGP